MVPELEPFNSNVPPARLIVPRLINGWLAPPGTVASSVALVLRVPSVPVSAFVKLDRLTTSVPLPKIRPRLRTYRALSFVPSDDRANVPPNRLIEPTLAVGVPALFHAFTVRFSVNVAPLATRSSPLALLLRPPAEKALPALRYSVPLVAMT